MIDYELLEINDTKTWNETLQKLPIAKQDIYFTNEYYRLYEGLEDGEAKCFVFRKGKNIAIYPFFINSINCLGYDLDDEYFDIQGAYGYNGIVSSSNDPAFISEFYNSFSTICKKENIISEFTRFHPILQNDMFSSYMDVIEIRETVLLDISKDYNFIWNNCYSSVNRNMIRKALKNNISVLVSNNEDDYIAFFDIHKKTMQNAGAGEYFYFSEQYFKRIRNILYNNHKLILAKYEGKIICAMILMYYGKYAHYHLSGRLREFSNTGVNNLILDEAIKIAQKENCSLFHFGGGNSNFQNDSLLKFKSNFSKNKLIFRVGKKIHIQNAYSDIVKQWEAKYPEKVEMFNNFILKYRY